MVMCASDDSYQSRNDSVGNDRVINYRMFTHSHVHYLVDNQDLADERILWS